ncbi:response regulator [Shewanella canadensis]|uniref:Response regulator n=1 Tax=Shewanella canadensis TaxID=271096 RepID=A0A3S0L3W7_9GAMM|nr:response regulator [Shewanella canadensis]RTR40591.1 response regulator [Shewanella canadensis]
MRILIADDDKVSRNINRDILSLSGSVDAVVNGAEAVQIFKTALHENDPYELICLDISMPFFDGMYALEEIRSLERAKMISPEKSVKIVMVTSSSDRRDILNARGKCNGYLLKPLSTGSMDKLLSRFKESQH